jgi:predicted dienelactone hydrolase
MNKRRWVSTIVVLTALLFTAANPVMTREELEQKGLRPDSPEYGKHGPFWVGYRPLIVQDGADQQLHIDLWYPARNPTGAAEEVIYEIPGGVSLPVSGRALLDAPIDGAGGQYPLVVFSHGFALSSAWYNTLTEHYASHGFIVLAPTHADQPEWLDSASASIDRPHAITETLDYAEELTAPGGELAGKIDMENVAVVGHSYGGYTALAMAGAQFDMVAFAERCSSLPEGDPGTFLCLPMEGKEADLAARAGLDGVPQGLWPSFGDPRVTAIVPIAGDSYLFDEAGLSQIKVPMMVVGGTADTGTPFDWGTGPSYDYASSTRKVQVSFIGAEHMLVGTPCANMPWITETPFYEFICFDPVWDKDRALDLAHHFTTAFLLAELKGDKDAAAVLAPNSVVFPGIEYESTGF